jgi:hypothetical protein
VKIGTRTLGASEYTFVGGATPQITLDHAAAQRGVGFGLCGWRLPERRAGCRPTLQREHCGPG